MGMGRQENPWGSPNLPDAPREASGNNPQVGSHTTRGLTGARAHTSQATQWPAELHSTILIDAEGKVRWKRTGGDPFDKVDWLLGEVRRVNGALASAHASR